MKYKNFYFSV